MLSISKPIQGSGQGEYYLGLAATDDYYLSSDKEPPGYWLGEGAIKLGLSGQLKPDEFRRLLRGWSRNGTRPLVRNPTHRRRAGWDLTWSAPKSVSVVWSQASAKVRHEIEAALRCAVALGIEYLNGIGVVSRQGENGVIKAKADLVFAAFPHSTSRSLDPQLHIHTLLLNVGVRPDGTTGALEPKELYRHQLAAGTLFRAELACQLEWRLGLRAVREGRAFELMGVNRALIQAFSQRRAEIVAKMEKEGWSGARAAERVALATREKKEALPREELFRRWRVMGLTHGWGEKAVHDLLQASGPARDWNRERAQTPALAVEQLTSGRNHFARRHLVQAVAEEAQGRGLGGKEVLLLAESLLKTPELVPLREFKGEPQWTTREVLALERRLFAAADQLRQRQSPAFDERCLPEALERHPLLNAEQRAALQVLCQPTGITVVQGLAGTGKSTLFRSAREVWEAQGWEVSGAALAGKAARGLDESTGIPSQTLHRTLHGWKNGGASPGPRSMIVVDEAAMVGTRQLFEVIKRCEQQGASLVLCGDSRQLQAIERGGSFAGLASRLGAVELTEIVRQREPWARRMVKDFADGFVGRALLASSERGLVHQEDGLEAAAEKLVGMWGASHDSLAQKVILTGRREEVLQLNRLAQEAQGRAGHLSLEGLVVGSECFHVGDRVLFTRNSVELGVMNGDLGVVKEVTPFLLQVRLDLGESIRVNPSTYPHLRLGYALTTHKAQGATFTNTYILTGPGQDQELSYVEASRASEQTRWYLSDSIGSTIRQMSRSQVKLLASELVEEGPVLELSQQV